MIKVDFFCEVEGTNEDEQINLLIPRNCCFKINHVYYYGYTWDKDGIKYINLCTFLEEDDDREKILNKAYARIRTSNAILFFLYHHKITFNIQHYKLESAAECSLPITESKNKNFSNITYFEQQLSSLPDKEKGLALAGIHFFARHLEMLSLNLAEESLLNAVKVLELVSGELFTKEFQPFAKNLFKDSFKDLLSGVFDEAYNEQGNDREAFTKMEKSFLGLITTRRKILYCFRKYNIDAYYKESLGKVIQLRNKVGAHPGSAEVDFETLADASIMSKSLLSHFILGSEYERADLERKLTY